MTSPAIRQGATMADFIRFPASVLRTPSPTAVCTCEHWVHCDHACHGRWCDPTENTCDVAFVPDDGGLTRWGCADCTPGQGVPHDLGCELIGWSVPALGAPRP
ncbi:MAG TPA: hypothetical protein VIH94_01820 [Candidatus Limnocylindrales bacterium]